ncbi:hypothetical protein VP01_4883g2 [Puccinia sorghi]|uniref:Uncharacterized protein n=1 Tax=Puccinia sorghi TaxID=27349 RepID=A0A0L6UP75_9BASI|nr:hypothetical protein VP01_4883g2 [Puccinia sorghi]
MIITPKATGSTQRLRKLKHTFRRVGQCRSSHATAFKNGQRDAQQCARMFNDFLYVKFQEDSVESLVTDIKVAIKKLVDVGIELPQYILAYLVLFKFPSLLQTLKRQIMHSDKELDIEYVCNHLIQFNYESRAESSREKRIHHGIGSIFFERENIWEKPREQL